MREITSLHCRNAALNEINERYYGALSEYLRIHGELVEEFFETTVLYEKNSCALVPLTSALDALCALARVAEERRYCRPTIDSEGEWLSLLLFFDKLCGTLCRRQFDATRVPPSASRAVAGRLRTK